MTVSKAFNYFCFLVLFFIVNALFSVNSHAQQRDMAQPAKGKSPDLVVAQQPSTTQPSNNVIVLNVADIADQANKFVVNIQSTTEDGGTSYGSGFFVEENGLIVTNYHVIREAIKTSGAITIITTDGGSYSASVKGYDDSTDLALLEIKDKTLFTYAKLGDSDGVKVGEWVVAVGSPFGLDHTVTLGIISAKGRSGLDGEYDDYLQTDAAINFGNSGGPLVNVKGEVIGINTLVLAKGQGLGFAIPVNILKEILPQLRDIGRVKRSYLAVETTDISITTAKSLGIPQGIRGIRVAKVERDTPAAKAGLRRDDVITAVNGSPINSTGQFNRLISRIPPGTKVELKIRREEREFVVTAELIEKKPSVEKK
ncbi:MAG: trypsin-like peptidase domain-containing protein [Blastocatellia bacterium]|nr:trypsin-like peptidase domain-containing protein [Blastocatellia bacterium]